MATDIDPQSLYKTRIMIQGNYNIFIYIFPNKNHSLKTLKNQISKYILLLALSKSEMLTTMKKLRIMCRRVG